jgi:hypothetical protein
VAGGQGFAGAQPERAVAVGLPLGAEEQRRAVVRGEAALCQVVQVRDEDDPDARLGQRADDLAGDLGALALVGRESRKSQPMIFFSSTSAVTATW